MATPDALPLRVSLVISMSCRFNGVLRPANLKYANDAAPRSTAASTRPTNRPILLFLPVAAAALAEAAGDCIPDAGAGVVRPEVEYAASTGSGTEIRLELVSRCRRLRSACM